MVVKKLLMPKNYKNRIFAHISLPIIPNAFWPFRHMFMTQKIGLVPNIRSRKHSFKKIEFSCAQNQLKIRLKGNLNNAFLLDKCKLKLY